MCVYSCLSISLSFLPVSIRSRCLGCSVSHPLVCLTAKNDWSRKVQSRARSKHTSRLKGWSTTSEWVKARGSGGGQQQGKRSQYAAACRAGSPWQPSPHPPRIPPWAAAMMSAAEAAAGSTFCDSKYCFGKPLQFPHSLIHVFCFPVFLDWGLESYWPIVISRNVQFERSERTEKHEESITWTFEWDGIHFFQLIKRFI